MHSLLAKGLPAPLRAKDPLMFPHYNLSSPLVTLSAARETGVETHLWLARLLVNLAGYATVLLPGYLFILYTRRTGYLDRAGDVTAMGVNG